jgi:hypothetical protein
VEETRGEVKEEKTMAGKALKPSAARCDLKGCGMFAVTCSSEDDVDEQGLKRPAIPNLNVCSRHTNWPHSEDAKKWVLENEADYKSRK